MAEATGCQTERLRLVLDDGEVVGVDGGTVTDPDTRRDVTSVQLRMPAWRAHDLGLALAEWTWIADLFGDVARPSASEAGLCWALVSAAEVAGHDCASPGVMRRTPDVPGGGRAVAAAVLRKSRPEMAMETVIALVGASSWWMGQRNGVGYATALLTAAVDPDTAQAVLAPLRLEDMHGGAA